MFFVSVRTVAASEPMWEAEKDVPEDVEDYFSC